MSKSWFKVAALTGGIITVLFPSFVFANNLTISNVSLGSRDPGAKTVVVTFDVSWDNSWRNKINHDAAWLTVRLNNPSVVPTSKVLCQMSASGLNPAGTSAGTSSGLEIYVPVDKLGAFLRRSEMGTKGTVTTQTVQLPVKYDSCGFSDTDQIYASVFGLEMVLIPQGAFFTGDDAASTAALKQGTADTDPWYISSENALGVANVASGGYLYVSNANSGEDATGATFTIPAVFPKGYQAFYAMKYEITEGQWVEFVNSLPSAQARLHHDVTDNNHKNSDGVVARNTVSCVGSPLVCSTQRPSRPASFLNWADVAAFLAWDALRPMTELEFEKMARGPLVPIIGEYAWGNTAITAAAAISGTNEDGTETVTTQDANADYNATVLSGGDSALGPEYQTGPLRAGIFASGASTRINAGAGYYGVLDLSGNLKEHVVTIGNAAGRSFSGDHGNGTLTTVSGFEGYANLADWPGIDPTPEHGVTGADGSGFRGGSWQDTADRLRISDRFEAALSSTQALSTFGGRGARTYDGN